MILIWTSRVVFLRNLPRSSDGRTWPQVGKTYGTLSPSKSTVSTGLLLWRNDACWPALGSWPLSFSS